MSGDQSPPVSVVIPTLNAGAGLVRLLEALRRQRVDGTLEIVAIDSGSRDATVRLAEAAGVRVVTTERRQFNHGRARNIAVAQSTGRFIALTVQDALPTDDQWLARLVAPLRDRPEVAGSYGLQLAPPSAGLLARTRSLTWQDRHAAPRFSSIPSAGQFAELSPEERLDAIRFDNVTSCVRREAWEKAPFPERNFGEDMAWAREVLLMGYRIAYVPDARVWHCHERGRLYDLRRAYADGLSRAELVDWPGLALGSTDLLEMLRRMAFFLSTRRFDSMVDPAAIRAFLRAELNRHRATALDRSLRTAGTQVWARQVYPDALGFALALTEAAGRLCPDGRFPPRGWVAIFRFALIAVTGQTLGAAAGAPRWGGMPSSGGQPAPGGGKRQPPAMALVHRLLDKGV